MKNVNEYGHICEMEAGHSGNCRWTPTEASEAVRDLLIACDEHDQRIYEYIQDLRTVSASADWQSWCDLMEGKQNV